MAKKKGWSSPEQRDEKLSAMFTALVDDGKAHFGNRNIMSGKESDDVVVGLPFPKGAFCLRWMFRNTVWPLSRLTQIVGPEGSCKSALLYEMFRWFYFWGGGSVFCEVESKDSPDLRKSVMGPAAMTNFIHAKCESLEEWQQKLHFHIEHMQTMCKAPGGPGNRIPVCFGVDSVMAKAARETKEKVQDEGFAGRSHPLEAMEITGYLRVMPSWISEWPFCIVLTNHLKPDISAPAHMHGMRSPGGKALKFQQTFEIELHRKKDLEYVDKEGIQLKMVVRKNSLGPSRKEMDVNMYWKYVVDDAGEMQQETWWDWGGATIDLLANYVSGSGKIALSVREIIDLDVNKSDRTVSSKKLGIPRSSPVPYAVAAEMLDDSTDVLTQLYHRFGIFERPVFQASIDYRDQLDAVKKKTIDEQDNGHT